MTFPSDVFLAKARSGRSLWILHFFALDPHSADTSVVPQIAKFLKAVLHRIGGIHIKCGRILSVNHEHVECFADLECTHAICYS